MLKIARNAITHFLDTKQDLELNSSELEDYLLKDRGVFVTITKNSQLRGCIGHLKAIQKLYLDIIDNSINAAFHDPRFPPLSSDELESIDIEISVLSKPKDLKYDGAPDLLEKIQVNTDGVIISKGFYSATFLPQVWDELSKKEDFLTHLCLKAGLNGNEWKNSSLRVQTYNVIKCKERK